MTQQDLEKAYTEAVDQLARAVDANRLLTERLERQEVTLAQLRGLFTDAAIEDLSYGIYNDTPTETAYYEAYNKGIDFALEMMQVRAEAIDHSPAPSQDE